MDTLAFSLNAVLPILLTVLLGMLLRRIGWFSKTLAGGVNKLCFSLLIPLHIFQELYETDIRSAIDWRFIGFGVGFIFVTLLLLCLLVPRLVKDPIERGECVQGVFRGSVSLISVSLLTNLYGSRGVAEMSILLPITLILYNALSVVVLSVFFHNGRRVSPKALAWEAVTNPFVVASVLGSLFALLRLRLPAPLRATVQSVGAIGSPLALLAMGALIDVRELFHHARTGLIASLVRQALIPVAVLGTAVLLGFRGEQLGAYLCIVCTPTASVGYVLSINMGGNGRLASQIVVYTTALSFLSMFAAIALLHGRGLL